MRQAHGHRLSSQPNNLPASLSVGPNRNPNYVQRSTDHSPHYKNSCVYLRLFCQLPLEDEDLACITAAPSEGLRRVAADSLLLTYLSAHVSLFLLA